MGFRLRVYDENGTVIGWMTATRADPAPEIQWRSPWEYEYEITHPEPERWESVEVALQKSEKPYERGKAREGAIEIDGYTYFPDRTYRADEDGPEAYLEEVAWFVEWHGAASTEIIEE